MAITYAKAKALKLMHYYHPLLVGAVLSASKRVTIAFLGLEPALQDFYQVYAYGVNATGKKVKRPLHRVAKEHGLTPPQEIAQYLTVMDSFE
jgi:hypothetical protein